MTPMSSRFTSVSLLLALLILCLSWNESSAQRIVSGRYTYRYVLSDSETVKQAEVNAVKQAQLGMIADHFGTLVSSTTAITLSETSSFITYGDTEVKGEWLEDTAAPVIIKSVINDNFVLDVTVSGIDIVVNDEQPLKAELPKYVNAPGSVIFFNAVQL